MDQQFRGALLLLGIDPEAGVDPSDGVGEAEARLGWKLPASVVDLVRYPTVMSAIAEANEFGGDFPRSQTLADGSYMPDVEGPVLWLLWENQGVVVWGTPLDKGDNPPVLVGWGAGDGMPTVEFAPSVPDFVHAMAWDGKRIWANPPPPLEALAQPLDPVTLAALRARYREATMTHGWPCANNYRFEGEGGTSLLLWACDQQCDWNITADDLGTLEREARSLLELSNLRESFESDNEDVQLLLSRVRSDSGR
jgi:hypothetical protein